MKFIETNQPVALGDRSAHRLERVYAALQGIQFRMHRTHEFVKMDSRFAPNWHRPVKAVHQETLTTADAPPHPDAARHLGGVNQSHESVSPSAFEGK